MSKVVRFVFLIAMFLSAPAATSLVSHAYAQEATTLRAAETVLSTTKVGRWAGETTATFTRGEGQIHVFVRLENPARTATQITVSIEREGQTTHTANAGVTLEVPANSRWRTFARMTTHRPAGRYRAVIRASDGTELSTVPFEITE